MYRHFVLVLRSTKTGSLIHSCQSENRLNLKHFLFEDSDEL